MLPCWVRFGRSSQGHPRTGPSHRRWSITWGRRHVQSRLRPFLLSFSRSCRSLSVAPFRPPCRGLDGGQERVPHCKAHTVYPRLVSSLLLPEVRVVLFAQGSVVCKPCFFLTMSIQRRWSSLLDHGGLL